MITPEYLEQIVHATEERTSILHEYLIGRIAEHIASFLGTKKEPSLMPSNIKQIHKLMESGVVYEDIQKTIEKQFPKIQQEAQKAFLNSAAEISKANTAFEQDVVAALGATDIEIPEYTKSGVPTSAADLNLTDAEVKFLEADYNRTNGTLKNIAKSTALAGQNAYIEAVDGAIFKAQHGVGMNKAIEEAIKEVADKGVGVVLYSGGRRENIEVVIARAVRTGINQANAHIVLQHCAEMGLSYVSVSEHLGARVTEKNDYTNHSYWQGKVYSIDWDKAEFKEYSHEAKGHLKELAEAIGNVPKGKYPDFVETCGYGKLLGICGVNCRHTFSAFYPNIMPDVEPEIDKAENEKRFKEVQQLRAMERAQRKTKRRIAGLKEADSEEAKTELKKQKALLKRQSDAYRAYCKEHNLREDGSQLAVSVGDKAEPELNKKVTTVNEYDLSQKKGDKKVYITDEAIKKVSVPQIDGYTEADTEQLTQITKGILQTAQKENDSNEVAALLSHTLTGKMIVKKGSENAVNLGSYNDVNAWVLKQEVESVVIIHNHPKLTTFSYTDLSLFSEPRIKTMIVVTNAGKTFILNKTDKFDYGKMNDILKEIAKSTKNYNERPKKFFKRVKEFGAEYIK